MITPELGKVEGQCGDLRTKDDSCLWVVCKTCSAVLIWNIVSGSANVCLTHLVYVES